MDEQFSQIDFGPLKEYLENDDITDISYDNGGQLWLKTLSKGVYRVENNGINNALMEKIAFQCANSMGKSFNMANPMLDAESTELRMNFLHDSIAKNGIAVLIRKTPAKIRLEKDKIIKEDYIRLNIHDFLLKCVEGHCNIIVSGETGSGKTEFIKYLASHTKENEKLITIEDTLELHLDKIFPHRDIVAMKTNNIASYSDILVACMRQNPRWILLSEVRSAEAVMAVRNSISSGHNILSTIHADKAESIPNRMYSLLETNQDVTQFLATIHRYVQLGVHIKGYFSQKYNAFHREVSEVVEFYVDEENNPKFKILYKKTPDGKETIANPTKYLRDYLESQGVIIPNDILVKEVFREATKPEINQVNDSIRKVNPGPVKLSNAAVGAAKTTSMHSVSGTVNKAPIPSANKTNPIPVKLSNAAVGTVKTATSSVHSTGNAVNRINVPGQVTSKPNIPSAVGQNQPIRNTASMISTPPKPITVNNVNQATSNSHVLVKRDSSINSANSQNGVASIYSQRPQDTANSSAAA